MPMTEIGMLPEGPCQGPAVVRKPALLTPLMCTYYVMEAKLFWANSPNIDKHFMATAGNVSPNTPSDRQLPFGQSVPHAICHKEATRMASSARMGWHMPRYQAHW